MLSRSIIHACQTQLEPMVLTTITTELQESCLLRMALGPQEVMPLSL